MLYVTQAGFINYRAYTALKFLAPILPVIGQYRDFRQFVKKRASTLCNLNYSGNFGTVLGTKRSLQILFMTLVCLQRDTSFLKFAFDMRTRNGERFTDIVCTGVDGFQSSVSLFTLAVFKAKESECVDTFLDYTRLSHNNKLTLSVFGKDIEIETVIVNDLSALLEDCAEEVCR